jgi:ferritin-like metal-binding protein YciE
MKPLEKFFWEELAEMAHTEELLLKWLPKMRDAVCSPDLKQLLEKYLANVHEQLHQVKSFFEWYEVHAREKKSESMMGLLSRGQQLMQRSGSGPALDAALVATVRKIAEHNRLSYDNLAGWARALEEKKLIKPLEKLSALEDQIQKKFESIQDEHDREAADQMADSPRRTGRVVKKTRELVEGNSWGNW